MNGTRELIQKHAPRFKAVAMKAFNLTTEADWQDLKIKLLAQLDASTQNAEKAKDQAVELKRGVEPEAFVPQ
jgi:hypothetical protein